MGRTTPAERPALTVDQIARSVTADKFHLHRTDLIQTVANELRAGASGPEVEQATDAFLATPEVIRIGEAPRAELHHPRQVRT